MISIEDLDDCIIFWISNTKSFHLINLYIFSWMAWDKIVNPQIKIWDPWYMKILKFIKIIIFESLQRTLQDFSRELHIANYDVHMMIKIAWKSHTNTLGGYF